MCETGDCVGCRYMNHAGAGYPMDTGAKEARNNIQDKINKVTPGGAPTSTAYPGPQGTYPNPEPLMVKPSEPLGASGWVCPACGKGNAPWVAQCCCEGASRGYSTTSTKILVTPSSPQRSEPQPCACCLLPSSRRIDVVLRDQLKGWICQACYDHCQNHWDPDWHTHNDEGTPFGPVDQLSDRMLRRYHFSDGTTYFNDEDPDDYK